MSSLQQHEGNFELPPNSPEKNNNRRVDARRKIHHVNTYLQIEDNLAHGNPEEPSARHVPNDRRRQTEQYHQKVSHSQVNDKIVRHSPHGMIPVHSDTHQRITNQSNHEHHAVEEYQHPHPRPGIYVVTNVFQILLSRSRFIEVCVVRRTIASVVVAIAGVSVPFFTPLW